MKLTKADFDFAPAVGAIGRYCYAVAAAQGTLRVMYAGDSHMGNASDNMGGLRVPHEVLFQCLGIPTLPVGDIAGNSSNNRLMYNTWGNKLAMQCIGGISAREFRNGILSGATMENTGTAAATLPPFLQALIRNTPDIVILSLGSNATGSDALSYYTDIIADVAFYNSQTNRSIPVVFIGAPDSIGVTVSYYNVDTTRVTNSEYQRSACMATASPRCVYVSSQQAIGFFSRYPDQDFTSNNGNANAMFYDGTHGRPEMYAMMVCGSFSAMFGGSPAAYMDMLQATSLYCPITGPGYGAPVAAAGNAVMVAGGQRKIRLLDFTVHNPHATDTATVTLARRRISQDTTTTATDTTHFAWTVPPGGKVRGVGAMKPIAWYNEGWKVTVATADVNIQAEWEKIVA